MIRSIDDVPLRVRERAGDLGAAVIAFVIGGMASDATDVATTGWSVVNDLVGIAAVLTILFRRRHPVGVAVATFVAAAVAPLAGGAAIVSVFDLASRRGLRISAPLVGLYVLAGVVSGAVFPDEELGSAAAAAAGLLFTLTALGWGLVVRSRRELVATNADRAVRAERARIAAEMHDVLAHRLSLLSIHAGAIEVRPDAPPEELARAAAVVRASAHQALDDLRSVLGVLRHEEGGPSSLAPLPAGADVASLIDECRAAGMDVAFDAPLDVAAVPPATGRHLYRVVQEGLTNARKHAPGERVVVRIGGEPGTSVDVAIENGRGGGAAGVPGARAGLLGLAERVDLAGGTFCAGPEGGGRFVLAATLPWEARP